MSDNAAKALQLFEIGFTISGASKYLPVVESTVKGYHKELQEKIASDVVWSVGGTKPKRDVWGKGRNTYAQGKNDGKAKREADANVQVTDRKEQIDPKFRERELPLNKGVPLSEIPADLITINAPEV